MRTPVTFAVKFLAVIAVLGLVSFVLAPASHVSGPYISALSDLAASSALAAKPGCPNKQCVNHKCVSMFNWTCKTGVGSYCSLTTMCS